LRLQAADASGNNAMTKYRFVQIACPSGERICEDVTDTTGYLFCSYQGE
jgi:hypothetical protein